METKQPWRYQDISPWHRKHNVVENVGGSGILALIVSSFGTVFGWFLGLPRVTMIGGVVASGSILTIIICAVIDHKMVSQRRQEILERWQ